MGRKYIGFLSLTAAVFGIAGLIGGHFVTLPTFKASDGGGSGDDSGLYNPNMGVYTPWLAGYTYDYTDNTYTTNAYPYICPLDSDWYPNPMFFGDRYDRYDRKTFYRHPSYPLELVAENQIGIKFDGPLAEHRTDRETRFIRGDKLEYSVPYEVKPSGSQRSTMIASDLMQTERLRVVPRGARYYDNQIAADHSFLFLMSDLVGSLSDGKVTRMRVTLCTRPASSGGTSTN